MPVTITPQIVNINAQVVSAPQPSTLQQSGAILSFGGTTLTPGTYLFCGTVGAVASILSAAGNFVEVNNMATTFFAQGNSTGLYVLELGTMGVTSQINALNNWIVANPNVFYAFLVPANWDTYSTGVNTIAANYGSPTGKTYFFVTTTVANVGNYTTKAVFATVPSPTAASTEFQAAAMFSEWLGNNPTIASPAAPMAFRYLYGVTPWVQTNNATPIQTVLSAYGNLILTGAEGGISTATLRNGTTSDGNQAMFWYAVDWIQIQARLQLANAIINGSNSNPPVVYNQFGINYLLAILQTLGKTGVSIGLVLQATFAATSFVAYTTAFPGDYAIGRYAGFSCNEIPQLGFLTVTFNLTATTFA